MVEKQFQITAALGHSKGLSHRAFAAAAAALQFGGSCAQPVLVGTTVGKLEVNSLTRHAPVGLWGICSRHAQTTWH